MCTRLLLLCFLTGTSAHSYIVKGRGPTAPCKSETEEGVAINIVTGSAALGDCESRGCGVQATYMRCQYLSRSLACALSHEIRSCVRPNCGRG
jgi:hypothetical protein